MARSTIPPPQQLEMTGDMATNWETFRDSWDNYAIATELSKKPDVVVVATLLTVMGKDCFKIYKNLPLTTDERKSTATILDQLGEEFQSKRNIIYERYLYLCTVQEPNENFDRFLNRLRERIATCKYATLENEMLRDRLVFGITNNDTRERLLREKDLDLDKAINICRTSEMAVRQLHKMDPTEAVHYTKTRPTTFKPRARNRQITDCKYCGDNHKAGKCKAYGQVCSKCKKENHLAKVCMSDKWNSSQKPNRRDKQYVRQLQDSTSSKDSDGLSSDESLYALQSEQKKRQYFAEIVTATEDNESKQTIKFQLDTGATCSTITLTDYNKITEKSPEQSNTKLRLYNQSTIKPVGQVNLRCSANGITRKVHFQIIKDAPTSLLSGRVCEALKLLEFNEECVHQLTTPETALLTKEQVLTDYKDVFTGLGKLPGTYHIEIDETVKPVQNNPRRVPFPVKEELKQKIDELEEMGVLAKVKEPTPWISSMVVVKKPNKLRICLDPLPLNKAIIRNHYPTPTIEEVAPKLSNAKIFSVVDAKDGFLQVVLDEPSSYLTTFWTPYGRYRWLRMPFGIKSAPEEFQRRIDECIEGLPSTTAVHDDILIYGTGDTEKEATECHDAALTALLERCRECGLKLNKKKLKFKLDRVAYLGHVLSADGISVDPSKVEAICDMPQPSDVAGVQRLIGVVTYLSKFLPQLSTVAEPLRRLTDKTSVFDWLPQHEEAFSKIKTLITEAPILHYYDVNKEVAIECDSSEVGLGAVITQEGHPIAYASRALTQTERNYAQIEKECLAIVFASERFDNYIIGKENVRVFTDHKPLVTIFQKPILTSPKRLQRMRLRLQKFSLDLEYKPGPKMFISDTLSRAALAITQDKPNKSSYQIFQLQEEEKLRQEIEDIDMDEYLFVSDERLNKIKHATTKDPSLQTLMNTIQVGWPDNKTEVPLCLREYWPYRDELSAQNGLAYRGTRVIIPTAMRSEMINRAHASHLGIQYTTGTAREIMYWPRMSAELTEAVQRCATCQESKPAQQKEPMMTYPIPQLPWQAVASDCLEVKGEHYLVLVDLYSDYIEVAKLPGMSTRSVIQQLKPIFATHGTPAVLITDNGPNYSSQEFRCFTESWEIHHVTTSPHHHKSNGKVESAVKIIKSIITRSKKEEGDMWKAILEWRNAPTPGTSNSPIQRLMSRRTRSMLPCSQTMYKPKVQTAVTEQIIHKRKQAKYYHDRNAKSLPRLVIGQPITVKAHPQQPRSNWKPGSVVSTTTTPRSYIVEVDGRKYRRNRVHLRDSLPQRSHPTTSKKSPFTPEYDPPDAEPSTTNTVQLDSPDKTTVTQATTSADQLVTRSGRVVKPPAKLSDYTK